MTEQKEKRFTVITNENYQTVDSVENRMANPIINYNTNPMYEKLLQFKENQKKKRFTVEDLLRW